MSMMQGLAGTDCLEARARGGKARLCMRLQEMTRRTLTGGQIGCAWALKHTV
jgi:hypothetical protein